MSGTPVSPSAPSLDASWGSVSCVTAIGIVPYDVQDNLIVVV